jgi:hypothetical protein
VRGRWARFQCSYALKECGLERVRSIDARKQRSLARVRSVERSLQGSELGADLGVPYGGGGALLGCGVATSAMVGRSGCGVASVCGGLTERGRRKGQWRPACESDPLSMTCSQTCTRCSADHAKKKALHMKEKQVRS